MSKTGEANISGNQSLVEKSKSLEISQRGVTTGNDFALLMSSLMSDLIAGSISPQIANAVCNAGGKLLKVVEMRHKYGREISKDLNSLVLAEPSDK